MLNYFTSTLGMNHVPSFLRAQTPGGLRKAMLRVNAKHGGFVKYFDIQYVEKEDRWYAWYFVTEDMDGLQQILSGEQEESR